MTATAVRAEDMESFTGALHSAREHALKHEVLTGEEINSRFPGYDFPAHFKVIRSRP